MTTGLNDFLKHIKSNPQNDVLVDRFASLVMELDAKARQPYFEKLFGLLEEPNPHGALRAAYFNLQTARAQGSGTALEIEALQWIERAFIKLGKSENAALVREELSRLQKAPAPGVDRRRKKPVAEDKPKAPEPSAKASVPNPKDMASNAKAPVPRAKAPESNAKASESNAKASESNAAEQRFTTQRMDFIANLYESFAKQLLEALNKELAKFKGQPHSEAAAAHIIKAFRQVYAEMRSTLRNAVAVFGHNPLLVDDKDRFRDELIQVFLQSTLLARTKDRMAAQRARLIASLLTAWFDQQQNMPEGILSPDQERVQNKLLEIAVSAVLRFED
jgi:molecular chaperone GrpE (heat shock protein)